MERMSREEQSDMILGLREAVAMVASGETAEKALAKTAAERGYSVPKIERLCEAYNKSKSIHVLSNAPPEKRAEEFDLANFNTVVKLVMPEAFAKTASLTAENMKRAFTRKPAMNKTASEVETKEREYRFSTAERNRDSLVNEKLDAMIHGEALLKQAMSEMKEAEMTAEAALKNVVHYTNHQDVASLTKTASYAASRYGDKGRLLLDMVFATRGLESPKLSKTASVFVPRAEEPWLSIDKAVSASKAYASAAKKVEKLAKQASVEKEAVSTLGMMMGRIGANSISRVLPGQPALDDILTYEKEPKKPDAFPRLDNRMKAVKTKILFNRILNEDDFVRGHDPEEVREAFNTVMELVPGLAYTGDENFSALRALVKKQLAAGNLVDPEELPTVVKIRKGFTRPAQPESDDKPKSESLQRGSRETDSPPGFVDVMSGSLSDAVKKIPDTITAAFKTKDDKGDKKKDKGGKK